MSASSAESSVYFAPNYGGAGNPVPVYPDDAVSVGGSRIPLVAIVAIGAVVLAALYLLNRKK